VGNVTRNAIAQLKPLEKCGWMQRCFEVGHQDVSTRTRSGVWDLENERRWYFCVAFRYLLRSLRNPTKLRATWNWLHTYSCQSPVNRVIVVSLAIFFPLFSLRFQFQVYNVVDNNKHCVLSYTDTGVFGHITL
jgi:hypothetical protein